MSKYSKRIVKKIIDLMESDFYTVNEICSITGICKDTYYTWIKTKPDFSDAVIKALEIRNEKMVVQAKKSLFKIIEGFYAQDLKTIYKNSGLTDPEGKPIRVAVEWQTNDKYYPPQLAAIIFVLTNLDPEHWKNTWKIEISGKGGRDGKNLLPNKPIDIFIHEAIQNARKELNKITDAELLEKTEELERKFKPINSQSGK